MKEFDITITENLEKTLTVEAANRQEAEEKIKRAYYDSEYVLDSENFTGVQFEIQAERELQPEQAVLMDVLLVKPGMYPQAVKIGSELEYLQKAVSGDIEVIYPFDDPVALIVNEEGKLNGSPLNRALRTEDRALYDIAAGDFLVVGLGDEDFTSLPTELMEKYEKHFHQPEMFVRMGKSIMVFPIPDDKVKKADTPVKTDMKPSKDASDRDSL